MHTNAAPALTTPRALAILILLPLLFHLPELLGWLQTDPRLLASGIGANLHPGLLPGSPGSLDPNSCWTTEFLGHLAAEQWLAGQVPWWNAYSGLGAPLAAEMQPAALFLPFVLLMHFHNGLVWMRMAMQVIAGIGTYKLLRAMDLHLAACVAGGVLFEFCGVFAWFGHGPDRVAAFIPWLILGIEWSRTRALRGAALFALALAGSIYAGFPECAYINGLLALSWFALRLAQDRRLTLAAGTLAGGLGGLMLAAPVILPFMQYLPLADVGGHSGGASWSILPGPALAMLMMPYIAGPIAAFGTGPGSVMFGAWGSTGGYLGAATVVLAIAGLAGARRDRALRWMLLGWIALALCKSAGMPGIVQAMNLIPLVAQTLFSRYMQASITLACAVLGALAIDCWLTDPAKLRYLSATAASATALLLLSLVLVRPALPTLMHEHGYVPFLFFSTAWCLIAILAVSFLLNGAASRTRAALLGAVMLADVMGMAGLTLLSAPRGRPDTGLLAFLSAQPELGRVLALGRTLSYNDGAGQGFAAINETMLPTPKAWDHLLLATIHPPGNAINFPADEVGIENVVADLDSYRSMGVTLLVTRRIDGPAHSVATAGPDGPRLPWNLLPGQTVGGSLPAGFGPHTSTDRIAVDIGTYSGVSDGSLRLQLCDNATCADAVAPLKTAANNAPLDFVLDRKLPFGGPAYRWTLSHEGGTNPVAIWVARDSTAYMDGSHGGPRFSMRRIWPGFDPQMIFTNKTAEVYKMPNPAPYFDAPGCTLVPRDRTHLTADCPVATLLLRRELSFPGWRARINNAAHDVGTTGIFQSVKLQAGRSQISFTYAPPHIAYAWTACLLALIGALCAWIVGGRKPADAPHPARTTSSPPI